MTAAAAAVARRWRGDGSTSINTVTDLKYLHRHLLQLFVFIKVVIPFGLYALRNKYALGHLLQTFVNTLIYLSI